MDKQTFLELSKVYTKFLTSETNNCISVGKANAYKNMATKLSTQLQGKLDSLTFIELDVTVDNERYFLNELAYKADKSQEYGGLVDDVNKVIELDTIAAYFGEVMSMRDSYLDLVRTTTVMLQAEIIGMDLTDYNKASKDYSEAYDVLNKLVDRKNNIGHLYHAISETSLYCNNPIGFIKAQQAKAVKGKLTNVNGSLDKAIKEGIDCKPTVFRTPEGYDKVLPVRQQFVGSLKDLESLVKVFLTDVQSGNSTTTALTRNMLESFEQLKDKIDSECTEASSKAEQLLNVKNSLMTQVKAATTKARNDATLEAEKLKIVVPSEIQELIDKHLKEA